MSTRTFGVDAGFRRTHHSKFLHLEKDTSLISREQVVGEKFLEFHIVQKSRYVFGLSDCRKSARERAAAVCDRLFLFPHTQCDEFDPCP